jgi:energy-coupling factor transport system ATP-binding protein
VAHAGVDRPCLENVDLEVWPGECVALGGASGSGKSTLLRALAGVLPRGTRCRGEVRREGRIALLFQNLEPQLLCGTVAEEVALGLERECGEAERGRRVDEALAAVGLAGFERRTPESLSSGEMQRVVLAALLARDPAVLLLDEPTSALDGDGRHRLVKALAALKARGHALVVADHVFDPFDPIIDRSWALEEGRLTERGRPPGAGPGPRPMLDAPGAELARVDDLSVVSPGGRSLLDNVSLRLRRGERVLVTGANGAGKSTWLRALAGLVPSAGGSITLPSSSTASGGVPPVALLFQDPQRNLFERTVSDEVAFALRRRGAPRRVVDARVGEMLALCDLSALADRSPLRLSFGEQHRVALASVLATGSPVLLLDEPFAGLDVETRSKLLELVARETARRQGALVIASHDREPFARFVHRVVRLDRGRVVHD